MRAGIIAFVVGAGVCLFLPRLPIQSGGAYALIISFLSFCLWRLPKLRLPLLIALGLCWAMFRAALILSATLPSELEGETLLLQGQIVSLPEQRGTHLRFEFQVERLEHQGREYSSPGKVRLVWYRNYPLLNSGQHYRLQVRLKRPHGFMNPGGFDYEAWLFANRIRATGYVLQGEVIAGKGWTLATSYLALRQSLVEQLNQHLPTESTMRGFLLALALGERQWIEAEHWEILNRTGTSHLMAISGLHIGLIAAFGFFLGRSLWSLLGYFFPSLLLYLPAPHAGAIPALVAAVLYAAMAGFAIPAQRALIMVVLVMTALYAGRRVNLSTILLLALLLVVLLDPFSLMSAGFWLSFVAVAVIAFGISGRASRDAVWRKLGHIHILLAVGLMPLLLLFFMQAPILSPLANMIAVPLVSTVVVPLVLVGSLLLTISDHGLLLLDMADRLLGYLWIFLTWIEALPFSVWSHATPHFLWLLPAIIGCLILLMPRGLPGRWVGLIWLLPSLYPSHATPPAGAFDLTLLDVGQGLSAVVRTAEHTLVFDAGARFSDQFDLGSAVVAPFLRQQGVEQIDTFIISHGDNDHIGGASGLLNQIPARRILSSVPEAPQAFSARPCLNRQQWEWDGVRFLVMQADSLPLASENDRSCVLKVSAAGGSLLLSGDIEKAAEQVLLKEYASDLQAEILVAPHHGSKTSSSDAFIRRVNPQLVLYPLGYRNRYGFPHAEVHRRYTNLGLSPLSTAAAGAISIRVDTDVSAPSRYRQQHRRFWHAP